MSYEKPPLLLVAALLAGLYAVPGHAAGNGFAHPVPRAAEPRFAAAGDGVSLDDAVALVQQDTGGRVLAAETESRNGRRVHRIKVLLPNGSVRIVYVPAGNG